MNRMEELRAIEEHIEQRGIYRCRMGESHYGDGGISYRQHNKNKWPDRVTIVCQQCGGERSVKVSRRRQKYCSRACQNAATKKRGAEVACLYCGKVHYRSPYTLAKAKRYFCSRDCHAYYVAKYGPERTRR